MLENNYSEKLYGENYLGVILRRLSNLRWCIGRRLEESGVVGGEILCEGFLL